MANLHHFDEDGRPNLRLRLDYIANISHEMKTPLAVIASCVEVMNEVAVDDAEMSQQFLDQISEQGERLRALSLDLISLANRGELAEG